ncbi:hypothetical protein ACFL45_11490 [Candidatus Neomarinimicrobiota bacterium]
MLRTSLLIFLFSGVFSTAQADGSISFLENRAIPVFMALTGIAMAGIWTVDISKGVLPDGFWKSREGDDRLFWPHLIAEYATAAGLLAGAYGLYTAAPWGESAAFISLGALAYTATSNLGWSLAKRERLPYAIPMMVGLAGSAVSIAILF